MKKINILTKVLIILCHFYCISITNAQLKVGSNLKKINNSTNFQVEGSDTFKQMVVLKTGIVGIGTKIPDNSALLHLDVSSLPLNGKKGFLGPKVALISATDQTTIPNPTEGLMVYNMGTGGLGFSGYLFWNGTEWRKIDNSTSKTPNISQINCGNARIEPNFYTSGTAYNGFLKIPYSGGNGGIYSGGTVIISTGVLGLTATLQGGVLAYGSGELIFSLIGLPTHSSPNTASFVIPTNIIGTVAGCNAVVGQGSATGSRIDKLLYFTASGDINRTLTAGDFIFRINGSNVPQFRLLNATDKTIYVGINQQWASNGFEYFQQTNTFTTSNFSIWQDLAPTPISNAELNIIHISDLITNTYYRVTFYRSGPSSGNLMHSIIVEQF